MHSTRRAKRLLMGTALAAVPFAVPAAASAAVTVSKQGDAVVVTGDAAGDKVSIDTGRYEAAGLGIGAVTAVLVKTDTTATTTADPTVCQNQSTKVVACRIDGLRQVHADLGAGNDSFVGATAREAAKLSVVVSGGAGADSITGSANADTLLGGEGDDVLLGLLGDDALRGDGGNDMLDGGAGTDRLHGGAGEDRIRGGPDGGDAAVPNDGIEALPVLITATDATTPTQGRDLIDLDVELINGAEGDDAVTLGADATKGYVISGGAGRDSVSYEQSTAGVAVTLGDLEGDGVGGRDSLDVEDVIGSAFADSLTGDAADNRLVGGDGDDNLDGREGSDDLDAGAGADTVTTRDAAADTASCGEAEDSVTADRADSIAADCEAVDLPPLPPVDPTEGSQDGGTGGSAGGASSGGSSHQERAKDEPAPAAQEPSRPAEQPARSSTSGAGAVSAEDTVAPVLRLSRGSIRVTRGARFLKIRAACPAGEQRCVGILRLVADVGQRKVTVGKATFTVIGGQRGAVRVKLTRSGLKLLRSKRYRNGLKVSAVALVRDAAGNLAGARSSYVLEQASAKKAKRSKRSTRRHGR